MFCVPHAILVFLDEFLLVILIFHPVLAWDDKVWCDSTLWARPAKEEKNKWMNEWGCRVGTRSVQVWLWGHWMWDQCVFLTTPNNTTYFTRINLLPYIVAPPRGGLCVLSESFINVWAQRGSIRFLSCIDIPSLFQSQWFSMFCECAEKIFRCRKNFWE